MLAGAASAVQDQHRVHGPALRIAGELTECQVVQAEFRQLFAGLELEVMRNVIAFGYWIAGGRLRARRA